MTDPTTGTTANDVTHYDHFYIGGQWVAADRPENVIEVVESRNGRTMAHVAAATPVDVDRAVAAARKAFAQWSATLIDERAAYMEALADRIEMRTEELAELGAREVGTPIHETRFASAVATSRYLRRLSLEPPIWGVGSVRR